MTVEEMLLYFVNNGISVSVDFHFWPLDSGNGGTEKNHWDCTVYGKNDKGITFTYSAESLSLVDAVFSVYDWVVKQLGS